MNINWYPGHMHKARKTMLSTMKTIDVLIEIVDARLPYSSQNPVIADWRGSKPTVVVLSKTDLADSQKTSNWQHYLEQQSHIKTLAYQKGQRAQLKKIIELCLNLAPDKADRFQPVNAMIVGIPNVGKSTLINSLAGKTIAKVGDEPAVTKQQQKIYIEDTLILHDTPGILWPKIENPDSGYRLAVIGSIKNTAVDYEDIGFYAAEALLNDYPQRLCERYQLTSLPSSALECLEAIGEKRGARQAGGRINLHKAAEILIHDIRSGELGPITLETPERVEQELLAVVKAQEEKAAKEAARKRKGKNRTKTH